MAVVYKCSCGKIRYKLRVPLDDEHDIICFKCSKRMRIIKIYAENDVIFVDPKDNPGKEYYVGFGHDENDFSYLKEDYGDIFNG